MLTFEQRLSRYQAQNGALRETPAQRRRLRHKAGHQSAFAVGRRAFRAAAQQESRRKQAELRAAFLPPTSSR